MDIRDAQGVRIFDYTPDPRVLLRTLREPLDELRSFVRPMVSLRRGWVHGSHLQVTVRPHVTAPAVYFSTFADAAAERVRPLVAVAPTEAAYVERATQLAAWENVDESFLPVHPQGYVELVSIPIPPRWSPELQLARDLIATEFVDAVLSAASDGTDLARLAARVLALLARIHPYGLGLGTLSYRSHAEGMAATVAGTTDLHQAFAGRFTADQNFFLDALTEGGPHPDDPLSAWIAPLHRAWGTAEALAASGTVSSAAIDAAGRLDALPVEGAGVSDFHASYSSVGLAGQRPHWFTAHRLVLNSIYTALMCLGLTPVQRYYVCYGLAEGTDRLLDDPWRDRLERLGAVSASL